MPGVLDYERRVSRRKPRPRWDGVFTVSAIGSGFVAWLKAASARGGPLPGELPLATLLVLASVFLSVIVVARLRPLRRLAGGAAGLACGISVAALLSGLATWELLHCRW